MNNLKLISLNIEGSNHLDKVVQFIKKEDPDVVCLQEAVETDVPILEKELQMKGVFAPALIFKPGDYPRLLGTLGLAILTKEKILEAESYYYIGTKDYIPSYTQGDQNSGNRLLLVAKISKDSKVFTFATTHFSWSADGKPTPVQDKALEDLFKTLDKNKIEECILCGDFNAKRGERIWNKLCERFTDNIPADVVSTIDPVLHRVKGLELVVDGVFSTAGYKVEDVRVVEGVSDHKGVVGIIS